MMVAGVIGLTATTPVLAANGFSNICSEITDAEQRAAMGCEEDGKVPKTLIGVFNVLIGATALIAVIMIVIAAYYYTISQGDAGRLAKAKNTIIYSLVGLVVALLAFAIVNFVLTKLGG